MIKVEYNLDRYTWIWAASNIKPTGKWRLINKKHVQMEITFTHTKLERAWKRFLGIKLKLYPKEVSTDEKMWINESNITFTEIAEFDCNEK